jgi:SRSO17 transposase
MIAVRVLPVIAELELGNIQRHIFSAHFVERADHARQALKQRYRSLIPPLHLVAG